MKVLLTALAVAVAGSLAAQDNKTGVLHGTVTDHKTHQPIIEAVITVSSPTFNGQKFAVTDSMGIYKVADLAAGSYTLVFEMEGYQKLVKKDVVLQQGEEVAVDAGLLKDAKSKTVSAGPGKEASGGVREAVTSNTKTVSPASVRTR